MPKQTTRNLQLDTNKINASSPYIVTYNEDDNAFVFLTDNDQFCYVSFILDEGVFKGIDDLYYILITLNPPISVKADIKTELSIVTIIQTFLNETNCVLCYFCDHKDTFDGRHNTSFCYQELRGRLFNWWYIRWNKQEEYLKKDAVIQGHDNNYFSILYHKQYLNKLHLEQSFQELVDCLQAETIEK